MSKKRVRKFILYAVLFITIMGLTFWNVFRGQDFEGMMHAVGEMSGWYVMAAVFLFLYRIFLFGNYSVCQRWAANAAVLHEKGWLHLLLFICGSDDCCGT